MIGQFGCQVNVRKTFIELEEDIKQRDACHEARRRCSSCPAGSQDTESESTCSQPELSDVESDSGFSSLLLNMDQQDHPASQPTRKSFELEEDITAGITQQSDVASCPSLAQVFDSEKNHSPRKLPDTDTDSGCISDIDTGSGCFSPLPQVGRQDRQASQTTEESFGSSSELEVAKLCLQISQSLPADAKNAALKKLREQIDLLRLHKRHELHQIEEVQTKVNHAAVVCKQTRREKRSLDLDKLIMTIKNVSR